MKKPLFLIALASILLTGFVSCSNSSGGGDSPAGSGGGGGSDGSTERENAKKLLSSMIGNWEIDDASAALTDKRHPLKIVVSSAGKVDFVFKGSDSAVTMCQSTVDAKTVLDLQNAMPSNVLCSGSSSGMYKKPLDEVFFAYLGSLNSSSPVKPASSDIAVWSTTMDPSNNVLYPFPFYILKKVGTKLYVIDANIKTTGAKYDATQVQSYTLKSSGSGGGSVNGSLSGTYNVSGGGSSTSIIFNSDGTWKDSTINTHGNYSVSGSSLYMSVTSANNSVTLEATFDISGNLSSSFTVSWGTGDIGTGMSIFRVTDNTCQTVTLSK